MLQIINFSPQAGHSELNTLLRVLYNTIDVEQNLTSLVLGTVYETRD